MRTPPKIARWVLSITNREKNRIIILGDYEEFFNEIYEKDGKFSAFHWYWKNVLKSVPGFIKTTMYWSYIMLVNYFKISLRNLKKQKTFSFINILGLAVGMACCVLIFLWVQDELSYDRYHEKSDRIYRAGLKWYVDNNEESQASTPPPLAKVLISDFPEVEDAVRVFSPHKSISVQIDNIVFNEERVIYSEESFFNVFSVNFIKGNMLMTTI